MLRGWLRSPSFNPPTFKKVIMGKNDKIATSAVRAGQKAPAAPEAAVIPAVIPETASVPEVPEVPEADIAYVQYKVAPKKAIRGSLGLKDSGEVVTVEDFGGDQKLLDSHIHKGLVVIEPAKSR